MRKQRLFWPLMAAAAMTFASCNNDNVPVNVTEADATVKITIVSSPGARAIDGTEAGSVDENKINKFEAYTFDVDGDKIAYAEISGGATTAVLAAMSNELNTIVVVANSAVGEVATLAALEAKLSTHTFTKANSTAIPATGIVMTGSTELTPVVGVNSATISMKRTVSKFIEPAFASNPLDLSNVSLADLQILFPSITEANRDAVTFAYSAYALANGLDESLLLNNADYTTTTAWGADRSDWFDGSGLAYLKSNFDEYGDYLVDGVYSGGFANAPVYVHENFPFSDTPVAGGSPGYDPTEVYCFIVKGTLTWNGTTVTRYWRINLVTETTGEPKNDYYRIFRNGLYKVTVDAIKTIGYATPEDAEKKDPILPVEGESLINITVEVAPWDVYISNTEM